MEMQTKAVHVQTMVICKDMSGKDYACEIDFDFWGKPFIYRAHNVSTGNEVESVNFLTLLERNNSSYLATLTRE